MNLTKWLRAEWDRAAGCALIGAGLVVLCFGIVGVRHATDVVDELAYLTTGGIGAMFMLGVGATLLLSADLHDDWRKLHRIEQKLDRLEQLLAPSLDADDPQVDTEPSAGEDVSGPPSPPMRRARILAGGATTLGLALLVAGRVHMADHPGRMTTGISLALASPFVAALVAVTLTVRQKSLLERRKMAVLGPWLSRGVEDLLAISRNGGRDSDGCVWVAEGLHRYHRVGCQALRGRAGEAVSRALLPDGMSACGLCEPG